MTNSKSNFKILVLDGGGAKGVYSLGILKELEKKLGKPLCEKFDLIYGTSTGSIIASLIALGEDVESIENLYFQLVPEIMSGRGKKQKSELLKQYADQVFGEKDFNSFKSNIGIVALNYKDQKPLIFKSNPNQAHGLKSSFIPGFGCKISDAVQASCSAYPIFERKNVTTQNQGEIEVVDGGFIANNGTLFALIDARKAFEIPVEKIRVLSIGTGKYVEKSPSLFMTILKRFNFIQFVDRLISANTTTNEVLAQLLYPELHLVRINEVFNQPEYGTNMVETDLEKLKKLLQLGRNSFGKQEKEIEKLFNG
ncbi:MAG: patatin-like phospholipase family protein [Balneolaceae bacterium]